MVEITQQYLYTEYTVKQRSIHDIAKELGTYPNRIRRLLVKYDIVIRTHSEAQKAAIKSGRHNHPTKGKSHSADTKLKIGSSISAGWRQLDKKEQDRRSALAKKQWDEMDETAREDFRKLAADAVRKAAEEGSKLEKFLMLELRSKGYMVDFHKEHFVSSEYLQVDLFLPELKVAIEIDGPTHFLPIWGDKILNKHMASDSLKTGLLLSSGYVLIRIKNLLKNFSNIKYVSLLTKLVEQLEYIRGNFPDPLNRLIEIELL